MPMCLQVSVLYLLQPGLGELGPSAVRQGSGEACCMCHSITQCCKVSSNLQLLIPRLKTLPLCTRFRFNIISLEFSIKCLCLFQIDHTLCLGTTSLFYIELALMNSCPTLKEQPLGKYGDILIFVLWYSKSCYKLIVEFNPKICHSKYLKYRHQILILHMIFLFL